MKINRRIAAILGSSTLAITAKVKELKAKGVDVINFAAGEPDFDTPDFIKKAGIAAIEKGFTKYTPSTGTPELKEAIAKKFLADNNLQYKTSQVIVSCGAKHSIYNLIQVLVDEGDEVVYSAPYWVSYPEMVKLSAGKSVIIKTSLKTNFKITADQLKKTVNKNTRVLILNSPSNPTGMVYKKDELESIAEICVKNNIFVISDEIYEKLIYSNEPYVSVASLNKDIYNLTATVNGVSKAYSMTGWRIGYAGMPQEIADYVQKFQDHTTSNPTSISQAAALAALQATPESISKMRDEFKKRRDVMCAALRKIPGVSLSEPEGAFYVFCNIAAWGMDSMTAAKKILEEANVAVIPGEGFGADDCMRLSFATSMAQVEEGTRRLAEWVQKLSSKPKTSLASQR